MKKRRQKTKKRFRVVMLALLAGMMILMSSACICGQHFIVEPLPSERPTSTLVYVRGVNVLVWGNLDESALILEYTE